MAADVDADTITAMADTSHGSTSGPDTPTPQEPLLKRIDHWFLIPLALLVVAAIAYLGAPQVTITKDGTTASNGTVVRIEAQVRTNLKRAPSCVLIYTIGTPGKTVEGTTVAASPSQCDYKIGDTVELYHAPDDPTQAVLADGSDRNYLGMLSLGALGALGALTVSVVIELRRRKRKSA